MILKAKIKQQKYMYYCKRARIMKGKHLYIKVASFSFLLAEIFSKIFSCFILVKNKEVNYDRM